MVTVRRLKQLARSDWRGYPGHGFYLKGHYKANGEPAFARTASKLKTFRRDSNRVEFTLKYGFSRWIRVPFTAPLSGLLEKAPKPRPRRRERKRQPKLKWNFPLKS